MSIDVMVGLQPSDPRLIGPYRLVGELGSGGMGRVFLGVSAGGRAVAVKVIRADLAADREFRVRFAREVAAARRVSGLFTAAVVDADVDGPVPWLATAYIAGPSLAEAVASRGPLPAAPVLTLAAGLAEGLGAIHAAGVVHRDLKPANVLLADDGPRVIDFGISRAAEATSLTRTGFVIGSPGFMSPEQAEGREVGTPSDIFCLGSILVFAATGRSPFGAGPTAALVYRIVHAPPDLGQLPAQLKPLVDRCLAKDPGQRPAAGDLLAVLDAVKPAPDWLPEPIRHAFARDTAPDPSLTGIPTGGPGPVIPTGGEHASEQAPAPRPAAARELPRSLAPAPDQPPPAGDRGRSGPSRTTIWVTWGSAAAAVTVAAVLFALTFTHRTPSQVTSGVSHPPTRHAASTPPGITKTVAISAKTGWQSTNIYLTDGEKYTVRYVSGTWTVDHRNFPYVSPAGYSNGVDAEIYQPCKYDAGRNYGVLLGIVGSKGHEFPIGEGGQFAAVAPGHYSQGGGNGGYLYLRINDGDACLGDNAGSVTMQVSTS